MTTVTIRRKNNYTLTWKKRGGIHTNKGLFIDAPRHFVKSIMKRTKSMKKRVGKRMRYSARPRPTRARTRQKKTKKQIFSTANVGYSKTSTKLVKTSQVADITTNIVTRQLTWAASNFNLTGIALMTGVADESYKREKNVVFLKGFTIDMQITNPHVNAITMNFAILAPKNHTAGAIGLGDFFRSKVDGPDGRGHDFAIAYNNMDLSRNPINSDHHTVLMHRRTLLNGYNNSGLATTTSGKNYRVIHLYKKINREIRYEDNACTTPIFFVMWFDDFCAIGGTASTSYGVGTPCVNLRLFNHWQEA